MFNLKNIIIIVLAFSAISCSNKNRMGKFPKKIHLEQYQNTNYQRKGYYSEMIFMNDFSVNLWIRFDDEILSINNYKKSYNNLRLPPATRDFSIFAKFNDKIRKYTVRDFVFSPGVRYLVKFSIIKGKFSLWIEDSRDPKGTVVFGRYRPI